MVIRARRVLASLVMRSMRMSYLSPKTEVALSSIHGRGLFAKAAIEKDEIVAIKGGHIFERAALSSLVLTLGPSEIQIADDMFIGPVDAADREGAMLFTNHSCDPNVGVAGQIVFVAMRDIEPGEELTCDWAMTDDDDASIPCHCGADKCRGTITGKDWMKPELQERYRGYMSWYLERKIAKAAVHCA